MSGDLSGGPFRPFHQSFADFLLGENGDADFHIDDKSTHARIAAYFSKQCHDRQACDDFGLLNLPFHAAQAGILDRFLNDEMLLVMADPGGLSGTLTSASSSSQDVVRVYKSAIHHLQAASFSERAAYLQMLARQHGLTELAGRLDRLPFVLPFSVLWTTWQSSAMSRVIASNVGVKGGTLNTEVVAAVASHEGRVIAVTGCEDGRVRVWDVATGKPLGAPLGGHPRPIVALAVGELDHRTVIVSSGLEGDMQVWDLALARRIAGPIRSRTYGGAPAHSLALSTLEGVPVIVSGGSHGNVEVWELATGKPVARPMVGFGGVVHWVALMERDRHPTILALHNDRGLRTWDVASGLSIGEAIASECPSFSRIRSLALVTQERSVFVVAGGGDGNIRVWDTRTGKPAAPPLPAHPQAISNVAGADLDGHPVIVSGDLEGSIRVWDFATRRLLGESVRQHDGSVTFLAEVTLEGRPTIVSGGGDGKLRTSEASDYDSTAPGPPRTDSVRSLALSERDGRPVVVTGSSDGVLQLWDLATGRPAGESLHAHVSSVGRVITVGLDHPGLIVSVADDPTVDAHDWESHKRTGNRLYGIEANCVRKLGVGDTFESSDGRVWTCGSDGGLYVSEKAPERMPQTPRQRVGSSSGLGRVVRAWSLSTGRAVGKPICCNAMRVTSTAATVLDGRPVVLTAEFDQLIRVWDLFTGEPIGKPLNAETHVNALCAAQWNGRWVVISGDNQGTVRAFDVATAMPVIAPLGGSGSVRHLECCISSGRPIVGCVRGDSIDLTDLTTGLPVGCSIQTPDFVTLLSIGELDSRLTLITSDLGHRDGLRVWDSEGRLVRDIRVDGSVYAVMLMPGSRVAVGSSKGLMMVQWNPAGQTGGRL